PADHRRRATVEPEPHLAGHETLCASHIRGEVLVMGREPEPVVDELRVFLRNARLESQRVFRQHQRLERALRLMEQHRGRRLVDLPRFDADEAVLDHVDPPHTVFSTDDVQGLDQVDAALLFAVEADGHAFDERDLELVRGRRDLLRVGRPLVDVAWRTTPRILEHTCLDRAAPEVFVDAVWALLRGLDRNAVLARVVDLLLAGHVHPAAHGRDHREIGRERADGEVEANLVVALASAAVRDKTRVLGTGGVPQQLGEHARLAVVPLHLPSLRAIPNGISWPSSDRACRSVDAATKTVSSPARVPTTSSRRDASRAAASAFAVPGSERKMTRFAAIAPST